MTPQDYLNFAARFMTAIENGDLDTVRASYAPSAKIWHNHDGIEQSVDENLKVMAWMARILPARRYRIIRREALSDGVLQQHVLEATLPDGTPWTLDACVVIRMADGLITRLDEYLDSGRTAALRPKAG